MAIRYRLVTAIDKRGKEGFQVQRQDLKIYITDTPVYIWVDVDKMYISEDSARQALNNYRHIAEKIANFKMEIIDDCNNSNRP